MDVQLDIVTVQEFQLRYMLSSNFWSVLEKNSLKIKSENTEVIGGLTVISNIVD